MIDRKKLALIISSAVISLAMISSGAISAIAISSQYTVRYVDGTTSIVEVDTGVQGQ